MDFVKAATRSLKGGNIEVYPKFLICPTKDLMIRGKDFYACWLEDEKRWTTEEYEVISAIDKMLKEKADEIGTTNVAWMWDSDTKSIDKFHYYCKNQQHDNFQMLDSKLMFQDQEVTREDYVTRKLPYALKEGDASSWYELVSTLYSETERQKIFWLIGSVLSGDSKKIDKFYVFYGAPKTGKSTILNIIQSLFPGYCTAFDAKALGERSNSFALEQFKNNPLIAIDHDSNLSKIDENSRLNALISHESINVNEKYRSSYAARFTTTLLTATNTPVRITDSRSGLLRRVIDINPTGKLLSRAKYNKLMADIDYELGAIAYDCLNFYLDNKHLYDNYEAREMLALSNDFYDFMTEKYFEFAKDDETTLSYAYTEYTKYCEEANVIRMRKKEFKAELKSYFSEFIERTGDKWYVYRGFLKEKFKTGNDTINYDKKEPDIWLKFNKTTSLFDNQYKDCPAQLTTAEGTPKRKWENVKTTLKDIDTKELHFVKVPENHIVIDFDLVDSNGEKSLEKNLEAAAKFPETYAELSKSGKGIHLHYIYNGDASKLSYYYADKIEIKTFNGGSSLRRKLTKCNDIPIKQISWNLPLKGDTSMLQTNEIKDEHHLRCILQKCLKKEYGSTTCNVDFMYKVLDDSYNKVGFVYDVSDMSPAIYAFAANATNQAVKCIQTFAKMKFKSKNFETEDGLENNPKSIDETAPMVFFDVEVFPNLFLVCWKEAGDDKPVHRMFNPEPKEVNELIKFRLIGFNNRKYDNHMLYARLLGYSEYEIFKLSDALINKKSRNSTFSQAYNLSYTDIYDFSAPGNKKSLKRWEIELGLHHQELDLPWDKPVDPKLWDKVGDYCENDVFATEKVFYHLEEDWTARQILADIAGMTVNDTTNNLTKRIVFGDDRHPQLQFNYRNLGEVPDDATNVVMLKDGTMFANYGNPEYTLFDKNNRPVFPGYKFEYGKSWYRDEDPKEGGYVYATPGIYSDIALLDIASMHPSSIIAEELFGPVYTKRFEDIKLARIYIKHGDFESPKSMFDGKLTKYLTDKSKAKKLANALKGAINAAYGLTSASFDNEFRDARNKDNIVAKRGALFMINLKHEVQDRGFTVIHIKTDSIKIANATNEIIDFVKDYGKMYGYDFEHEATYNRMCLVNDAVYIAKYEDKDVCMKKYGYIPDKNEKSSNEWTATGTEFQRPYVFKKLFSHEDIGVEDLSEIRAASTEIYIDFNDDPNLPRQLKFVGKTGQFTPVKEGGGAVVRKGLDPEGREKFDNISGTLGYKWIETEDFINEGRTIDDIDISYYETMANKTIDHIKTFGDYYAFVA